MFGRHVERDERGATAVEYGLMLGMIFLAIVGAVGFFGIAVGDLFVVPERAWERLRP